jgi:post-segregation antitoxin (ccd killing protein)
MGDEPMGNTPSDKPETPREAAPEARQRRWLAENRAALAAANAFVERHGFWSDGLRQA